MADLVRDFRSRPEIRDVAARIVRPIDEENPNAVAWAVWEWVRSQIQYVLDPAGVEMIQSPDVTLRRGYGDCDDLSILAASLLSAVGVDAGFRAVAQVEEGEFDHVYVIYWTGDRWAEMDPISDEEAPGTGPYFPDAKSTLNIHINDDMPSSTRGRDMSGIAVGGVGGGGFGGGNSAFNQGGGGLNFSQGGGGLDFSQGGGNMDFSQGGSSLDFGVGSGSQMDFQNGGFSSDMNFLDQGGSEFGFNQGAGSAFMDDQTGGSGGGVGSNVGEAITELLAKGIEVTPQIIAALKGGTSPREIERQQRGGGGNRTGGNTGGGAGGGNRTGGANTGGGNTGGGAGGGNQYGGGQGYNPPSGGNYTRPGSGGGGQPGRGGRPPTRQAGVSTTTMLLGGGAVVAAVAFAMSDSDSDN